MQKQAVLWICWDLSIQPKLSAEIPLTSDVQLQHGDSTVELATDGVVSHPQAHKILKERATKVRSLILLIILHLTIWRSQRMPDLITVSLGTSCLRVQSTLFL